LAAEAEGNLEAIRGMKADLTVSGGEVV